MPRRNRRRERRRTPQPPPPEPAQSPDQLANALVRAGVCSLRILGLRGRSLSTVRPETTEDNPTNGDAA